MCVDPATMGVAATVVGTGLSIMDRTSSHRAAVDNRGIALNSVLNETVPAINQSLAQVYNSNTARQVQENDMQATERFDILRGMTEAKSTATAAAGDAGVGGVSFANILQDFEMREGLAAGSLDYNYATAAQQISDDNVQAQTKAKAQINSSINAAINSTPLPSSGALWAGIGSDAIGAGLTIGGKLGLFDRKPKVDANSGATY